MIMMMTDDSQGYDGSDDSEDDEDEWLHWLMMMIMLVTNDDDCSAYLLGGHFPLTPGSSGAVMKWMMRWMGNIQKDVGPYFKIKQHIW